MNNKVLSTLENIAENEINSLKKIIIFPEDKNSYVVYDKYRITKNKQGSFTIDKLGTHTKLVFYKLKNALTWCGYDKRNMYRECDRVKDLDQMIWCMDTEIQMRVENIRTMTDETSKLINIGKLSENRYRKRVYSKELAGYVNNYDRYQNSLFNRKPVY